jgi:hypothetical protein
MRHQHEGCQAFPGYVAKNEIPIGPTQRGIPVIPVATRDKAGVLTNQFAHATTDLCQIAQWNTETPTSTWGAWANSMASWYWTVM